MKRKLSQHRGHREILMKSVCSTVDELVDCGRRLHQCLTTSQVWPKFSKNHTFKNPLKNPTFYLVEVARFKVGF